MELRCHAGLGEQLRRGEAWRPSCRSPEDGESARAPAQGQGGAVAAGVAQGPTRGLASAQGPLMGLSLWPRGRAAGWLLEVGVTRMAPLDTARQMENCRHIPGTGTLFLGREEGKEMGMEGPCSRGLRDSGARAILGARVCWQD